MKNIHQNISLCLLVCAVILASLACNLPVGNNAIEQAASTLETNLAEAGCRLQRPVEIGSGQVTLAVDMSAGQTEENLYTTWIYLFDTALENAPNSKSVVIELYSFGEPYATLTGSSDDIEAVLDQGIDVLTFFSRVQMDDHRPPEDALRQSLAANNWIVTNVSISPQRVDIEAFPPYRPTRPDTVMDWFKAMQLAAEYAPDSQQVSIHLLLTEPPDISVMADMDAIHTYLTGELDPALFLAGLTISE